MQLQTMPKHTLDMIPACHAKYSIFSCHGFRLQMYLLFYVYCKLWYLYKEGRAGEKMYWYTWLYLVLNLACTVPAG